MYPVSNTYKTAMREIARRPGHARISFGIFDLTARDDATITSAPAALWADLDAVNTDIDIPVSYTTLDGDFIRLDGAQHLMPDRLQEIQQQGYISVDLSDDKGEFADPPIVKIQFSIPHSIVGLTLDFDDLAGWAPSELVIKAYDTGALVSSTTLTDLKPRYVAELLLDGVDRIDLVFLRTPKPHQRARLAKVLFGIGYSFDDNDILEIREKRSASPICATLPQQTMSFELDNGNRRFDLESDTALIRFLADGQQINISYGMEIDDIGTIEWIPSSLWQLDTFTADRQKATFSCAGPVYALNAGLFEKTPAYPAPLTAYEGAELVLQDTGVSKYYLSPHLHSVRIQNPLPLLPHAEVLQLIAGVSGCQMTVSHDGTITIEPILRSPEITASDSFVVPLLWSSPMATVEATEVPIYADLSQDFVRLDGMQQLLPNSNSIPPGGWVGNSVSGDQGRFFSSPRIVYTFDAPTQLSVITIDFAGCPPRRIEISGTSESGHYSYLFSPSASTETFPLAVCRAQNCTIEIQAMQKEGQRPRIAHVHFSPIFDFELSEDDSHGDVPAQLMPRVRNLIYSAISYVMDWERPESGGMGHEKETEIFNGQLQVGIQHRIEHGDTPIYGVYVHQVDSGITVNLETYAYVSYVTLTGLSSTANLILYGTRTTRNEQVLTYPVNPSGEDCEIDNELLGLMWPEIALEPIANYFRQRIKYEFDSRGFPELDALDIIKVKNKAVCLLESQLTFDGGAFSGKHTLRRWEPYGMD